MSLPADTPHTNRYSFPLKTKDTTRWHGNSPMVSLWYLCGCICLATVQLYRITEYAPFYRKHLFHSVPSTHADLLYQRSMKRRALTNQRSKVDSRVGHRWSAQATKVRLHGCDLSSRMRAVFFLHLLGTGSGKLLT